MRRMFAGLLTCALAGLISLPVSAEDFPTRSITLVLPFGPGSAPDLVGRRLADIAGATFGRPVIAENRTGAGTLAGTLSVKKASPDGYAVLFFASGLFTTFYQMQRIDLDPYKDFEPLTTVISYPYLIAVPTNSPINSVKDLMELAAKKKDGLSYGTQGAGSPGHLLGSVLQSAAKAHLEHIPYLQTPQLVTDGMMGRIDFIISSLTSIKGQLDDGKFKIIAFSSPQRLKAFPNIPTIPETVPGTVFQAWFGLMVPAGTPAPVREKLRTAFVAAAEDPRLQSLLANDPTIEVVTCTPEEVMSKIKQEAEQAGQILKDLGLKIN